MNSVPNSDSEQCTKSKLSRVHSAPILGPAYAHTAPCRWPGRVAGLAWQCRSTRPAVSQRTPAHRVAAPPRALLRAVSRSQQVVSWPCPRPCRNLSCDTTQRPSRPPVTIRLFVSRHNPPAARPSRAHRSPLRVGRPCRRASRPCRRPSP